MSIQPLTVWNTELIEIPDYDRSRFVWEESLVPYRNAFHVDFEVFDPTDLDLQFFVDMLLRNRKGIEREI